MLAARLLGPLRSLLASGAHATVFSALRAKRFSVFRLFFTVVALYLFVYDAMGRTTAAVIMRDSVMRNPTAKVVHSKLQSVGHGYVASLKGRLGSLRQYQPSQGHTRTVAEGSVRGRTGTFLHTNMRRVLAIVEDPSLVRGNSAQDQQLAQLPHAPQHQQDATEKGQIDAEHVKLSKRDAQQAQDRFSDNESLDRTSLLETNTNSTNETFSAQEPFPSSSESPISALSAVLGVCLAVLSPLLFRLAIDMTHRIVLEVGQWQLVASLINLSSAALLSPVFLVYFFSAVFRDELHMLFFFSNIVPISLTIGLCLVIAPLIFIAHYNGFSKTASTLQSRSSKLNLAQSLTLLSSSVNPSRSIDFTLERAASFYSYVLLSILFVHNISQIIFGYSDSLTFSSFTAAVLLLIQSVKALRNTIEPGHHRGRTLNLSGSDLSLYLGRSTAIGSRQLWMLVRQVFPTSLRSFKELASHARSNKASWQVLNFLILQMGMALVELVYASITQSTGLFSISADNFFCSIALAIGLHATRLSAKQSTFTFTYGYSRAESLCGFTNGVMLTYVAVLIVLEAYERQNVQEEIAFARAFSVCLFGVLGNVLGLFFFPPETRRENHNVQGIYLHIWANTLAFASMAISTAITASIPSWGTVDLITSALVALGVIALAVPLLVRSARLLLLMVPTEKEQEVTATRERLAQIAGVINISALRMWNLTPNHVVSSVKIEVSSKYDGDDEEILSRARSVFGLLDIPASQCTIQITRVDAALAESLVVLHKRSRSAVPDTGINLDKFPAFQNSSQEPKPTGSALTLLTV
ncbi:Cation efflux transmembrane [Gracilaria domingensis]|nr:Cation efflux transmembrane [Gracilaria domingensis]